MDCSTLAISVTNGTYNRNTRSINGGTLTVGDTGSNNTRYIAHGSLTFGNIQRNAPTVGVTSNPSTQQNTYDTLAII